MKILSAAVGLGVWALAATVWADVPPPNSSECQGKDAGVACTTDTGQSGTYQTSTCSRISYSPDAGMGTTNYPCLLCTPPDAGSGYSNYPPASDGGPGGGDAGASSSNNSSGCASSSATNLLGPMCLALLPLLLLRRRRS